MKHRRGSDGRHLPGMGGYSEVCYQPYHQCTNQLSLECIILLDAVVRDGQIIIRPMVLSYDHPSLTDGKES